MATKKKNFNDKEIEFEQRLVLFNWILDFLDATSFEDLSKNLKDPSLEGFTEDNVSKFYQVLTLTLFERPGITKDQLLAYDGNIVRHWRKITKKRNADGHRIYPKYFQYLCLLFTEIYLDFYFRDPEGMLSSLNAYAEKFNAGQAQQQNRASGLFSEGLPEDKKIKPFTMDDLNKIAFWSATGSGKTLLMHIHILQFWHYSKRHGKEGKLNRIILLTPNEGLSFQHKEEFKLSSMSAELFNKDAPSLFVGKQIEIIDIHKLKESSGEKTVDIDSFEGNNLVLVDEGHRGTSGAEVGHWMKMRSQLSEDGFSFEYSATFGQAMKASGSKELAHEYAKCILFDYSYKYFYEDGYGKEYRILNLKDDSDQEHRRRYLTACLLAFYQQQKLFLDKKQDLYRFLIEKPLWIFVGGSVTKTPSKKDVTDIVDILLFLARFVKNREESIDYLDRFLSGRSGLHDLHGNDLFAGSFIYLGEKNLKGQEVFEDILHLLFNADSVGTLHVRHLKGGTETEGEIGLHIGEDNEPFGVINVGDASGLCKLCKDHPDQLVVLSSEFSESLFRGINASDSSINILIGSKKFSEGWSSWRVSTMGLMNIGKKEGSQIIQLFGRGVRLKGYDFCLKRSLRIRGIKAPKDIDRLETLNIFGVQADYMIQFREYLEEEGLPSDQNRIEFVLPVVKNLGNKRLKTIKLKEGVDYKRQGSKPTLALPMEKLKKTPIVINWYPKIQAMASAKGEDPLQMAVPEEGAFTEEHLAFMNMDEIYFNLQQFKNERAWFNLNLSKNEVFNLLKDNSWYVLQIPREELEFRSFEQVARWEEITEVLLRKYCDRFYKYRKAEFEKDHLEYRDLTEDDGNFLDNYTFLIDQSRQDIVNKLTELKTFIESGQFKDFEFQGINPIFFGRHLYQPLLYMKNDLVEVKPVSLNEGERDFVLDLRDFCEKNKTFFEGRELYLLRNMTQGRGIGFFDEGNYYPDFILWILSKDVQHINFIDPKGLRNVDGKNDSKIAFHKTIKDIENDLRSQATDVILNAFIISNTRLPDISWWDGGMTKEEFEDCHVFFQQEDKQTYIGKILNKSTQK